MVDGMVGPKYPMLGTLQKFADSPSAPAWIELCARWLAAYFGFVQLREINKTDKLPTQASMYFKMAQAALKDIRKGDIDVFDAAGAEMASSAEAYSTTENRDATFTTGEYVDGDLQGDEGTLDWFSLD